jgi:membrane protein implicated in regulation of membrane protease activity
MVGVLQGNLAPPLFGVPIAVLFVLAWMRSKNLFIVGVASYYCLSTLVVLVAVRGGEMNWLFLVFWPLSLASLILWRRARVSAIHRVAQAQRSPTSEHRGVDEANSSIASLDG